MGIYLRRLAAFVPQQVLYVAQVHARFQQVGGERMAQGMHGGIRVDARLRLGVREDVLNTAGAVCSAVLSFKYPFYGAKYFYRAGCGFLKHHKQMIFSYLINFGL